jgi:flagellum-specific ATP synthase
MEGFSIDLKSVVQKIDNLDTLKQTGIIQKVIGLTIESHGPKVDIGEVCYIISPFRHEPLEAEVVGFKGKTVLLMPLGDMHGIGLDSEVIATGRKLSVAVGEGLLGRIIDGLGRPMDGIEEIEPQAFYPLQNNAPNPLTRRRITDVLSVGVKAIDAFITCGVGQRLGIFSGSGVGKSTLLGMIARNTTADINVIALIGERGREVREFIEKDLGDEGLKRSVVVVATSDQPALIRTKGAFVATAVAEYFRDLGLNVMLMMDSVTRFAMAQREVGLAIGEPPVSRGYTPSVFATLPKLLERSGNSQNGSITALYTVLVDGDDLDEPISDAVRGILDGHIVLSRRLAEKNHYPAVDVLSSISRLMHDIVDEKHRKASADIKDLIALYRESEDLINIGAYKQGGNPRLDYAVTNMHEIETFLKQDIYEKYDSKKTRDMLLNLLSDGEH